MKMRNRFRTAIILAAMIAMPAIAQELKIGPDLYAVTLHRAQLHPATPGAARRTLARIEDAALAACGASSFSLHEMKVAVRTSACWRDSMAATMARIDDPLLLKAYRRHI